MLQSPLTVSYGTAIGGFAAMNNQEKKALAKARQKRLAG